jgi:hypothetical protein
LKHNLSLPVCSPAWHRPTKIDVSRTTICCTDLQFFLVQHLQQGGGAFLVGFEIAQEIIDLPHFWQTIYVFVMMILTLCAGWILPALYFAFFPSSTPKWNVVPLGWHTVHLQFWCCLVWLCGHTFMSHQSGASSRS